jgi:hypothetical protein
MRSGLRPSNSGTGRPAIRSARARPTAGERAKPYVVTQNCLFYLDILTLQRLARSSSMEENEKPKSLDDYDKLIAERQTPPWFSSPSCQLSRGRLPPHCGANFQSETRPNATLERSRCDPSGDQRSMTASAEGAGYWLRRVNEVSLCPVGQS